MNATAKAHQPAEIWFTTTKRGGRRAYYYSTLAERAMPLPLLRAELLVAIGASTVIPGNPFGAKAWNA